MNEYTILLLYKYTKVENPENFKNWMRVLCEKLNLKGRIIIAKEGINVTLEGKTEDTKEYIEKLKKCGVKNPEFGDFSDVHVKTSKGTGNAFPRLSVKVRNEIVSLHLGEEDFSPTEITGSYLKPEELKKWYEENKDFVIVDMRNDYEFKVGHFKNSINPQFENFRDLPKKLNEFEDIKEKTVVTVCTGGVRCEKASGYLKKKGFKNVYQLHGGMHTYMEEFPGEDFLGALYTFDNRVVMDFGGNREIVGRCDMCNAPSERYVNCSNLMCHKHFICCENCIPKDKPIFCSDSCKEKVKI